MRTISKVLKVLVLATLLSSCAMSARLYNLDTAEVLTATYKSYGTGHGQITVTAPDGKVLVGEYSTISGADLSTALGSASASGSGGYARATAQGFTFNQPGQQCGSATAAGAGLLIDIVYVVDPWSGHGVGKDDKGGRYKLQF